MVSLELTVQLEDHTKETFEQKRKIYKDFVSDCHRHGGRRQRLCNIVLLQDLHCTQHHRCKAEEGHIEQHEGCRESLHIALLQLLRQRYFFLKHFDLS